MQVDVPGCTAAVEAAAMEAAYRQTDRLIAEWESNHPWNASMYRTYLKRLDKAK